MDFYDLTENLTKAGIDRKHAEVQVQTMNDITKNLATKDDIQSLREEMRAEFIAADLRFELKMEKLFDRKAAGIKNWITMQTGFLALMIALLGVLIVMR